MLGIKFSKSNSVSNLDNSMGIFDEPFISSQENSYQPVENLQSIINPEEEQLFSLPNINWKNTQNQFIVTFTSKEDIDRTSLERINPNIQYLDNLDMAIVHGSTDLIDQIRTISGVKDVYIDYIGNIGTTNNIYQDLSNEVDINVYYQSYSPLKVTGVETLHEMGITGIGTKVALLDSGVDINHPDLDDFDNNDATHDPKIIDQRSFLDYDGDGNSDAYRSYSGTHGTIVAGVLGGKGNILGVAPDASIISGQVFDFPNGITKISWIIQGIDWAVNEGADVISMSFGNFGYLPGNIMPLMNAAVDAAWEQGAITVIAAGNNGNDIGTICSPGKASRALTVGASNDYNLTTSWSSKGPSLNGVIDPDICAPGDNILTTLPRGEYTVASGTSLATPHVAGIAALLKSAYPVMNNDQIRTAILSTASDMGEHIFYQGTGLVNAKGAFDYLSSPSDAYAFPSFTESSPLILAPGEIFNYQLDIFLNQPCDSLVLEPSSALLPFVTTQLIDSNNIGWVRAQVNITMANNDKNGTITIKDGSIVLYEVELFLKAGEVQNDAGSGTDAGETLLGALDLSVGSSITGNITYHDEDIYSFSVVQDHAYSVDLTPFSGNLDIYLTDQYGQAQSSAVTDGIENISFIAPETTMYYLRVIKSGTLFSTDSVYSEYTLNISEISKIGLTGLRPIIFTGNNGSEVIDTDSDGLYNELRFYFELNVSKSGNYAFETSISHLRVDYRVHDYIFYRNGFQNFFNVGLNNFKIIVNWGFLESSGYNGRYVVDTLQLLLGDHYFLFSTQLEQYTNVTSTSFYNHDEFDPLDNHMLSYSVNEIDLDENSIPELIQLECEFNFSTSGDYSIDVLFDGIDSWSQRLPHYITNFNIPNPGIFNITIGIPAQELMNLPIVTIKGIKISWNEDTIIPLFHKIGDFGLPEFEPLIENTITDRSLDTNEDNKFDTLQFTFTINSKQDLSARLFTGFPYSVIDGTSIPFYSTQDIEIKTGTYNYTLYFDSRIFTARNLEGLYFFPDMRIEIYNYSSIINVPHLTKSYNISNFEYPHVYFSHFSDIEVIKTESVKGLKLTMDIIGSFKSDIYINITLKDNRENQNLLDVYFSNLTITTTIDKGINKITLLIDARDLYIHEYTGFLEIFSVEIFTLNTIRDLNFVDGAYHIKCIKNIDYQIFELPYQAFPNIYINGDPDFHAQAGTYNWNLGGTRDGSSLHPYLIQNYYVNNETSILVGIYNTNVFFQLVNCLIIGDYENVGILLYNVDNAQIINNSIANTNNAITFDYCNQIQLYNNTIMKNNIAIDGLRTQEVTVLNNLISFNQGTGLHLFYSNYSLVKGNTISNNGGNGMKLFECVESNVTSNTIMYNNYAGLYIFYTEGVVANWNTIENNYDAGMLIGAFTYDTIIEHNNITYNYGNGIYVFDSDNNTINNNEIKFCTNFAIEIYKSNNTKIKYNDFVRNNMMGNCQAKDDSESNIFMYNFWDEWTSPDITPIDGFVDNPYIINDTLGVQDPFPRAQPYREDIHILLSGPIILNPNGGELINGTITIQWDVAEDIIRGHTIVYTLYYSNNSGANWYPIVEDPIISLSYQWNTTELLNGSNYRIRVVALCSDGLSAEDISDEDFSIDNQQPKPGKPPFTVFHPISWLLFALISGGVLGVLLKKAYKKINLP